VLGGWSEPGGDQEAAEFVAVQRGGVRLVVQPGTTDVRRGPVVQEFFLDGVQSVLSPWVAWRLRPRSGRYARIMGTNYLISRKWALSDRFAISDDTGVPQFDVHGRFA
jgi:hypothetical protein